MIDPQLVASNKLSTNAQRGTTVSTAQDIDVVMRFGFYLENIEEVQGWLSQTTAFLSHCLMTYQTEIGIRGNVCEIGVHHGKYFIALACGLIVGETATAVDLFEDQHNNRDAPYEADREKFEVHVAKFLPPNVTNVIKADSTKLSVSDILPHGKIRFFSIDGGHTEAVTLNDLRLAEQTLCVGGIVALDDILNGHWTGVVSGYARYKNEGGSLTAFAMVPNKLLLTDSDSAPRYASFMRDRFALFVERFANEMMGDRIDIYGERPDLLETQLQKTERLQRELDAAMARIASTNAESAALQTKLDAFVTSRPYRIGSSIAALYNQILGRR